MAQIREIKARMKAVGNIQRITKTMQLIASARFQAMQKRAMETQPYTRKIEEVVGELADSVHGEISHPLLSAPEKPVGKTLLLVLTSNRGLCGAYNANTMRLALKTYKEIKAAGSEPILEMVGKKGADISKFNGVPVDNKYDLGDKPEYHDVERIAQSYIDRFTAGEVDSVKVVSMAFVSMSKQVPTLTQLLPLEPPKADESETQASSQYEFSPDPESLLGEILPVTVKIGLFQRVNEAVVSEQLMRMVAMKAATDAAGKQKKSLSRQYNRARQTAITTELSEIIAGAAALN